MLNIPPDLLGRFITVLEERGVPLAEHSYYKKWLRYYVDFCDKYRLEATSSKSQTQFLDKLREKKQTDWQIKQAAHSVSLLGRSEGVETLCGSFRSRALVQGRRNIDPVRSASVDSKGANSGSGKAISDSACGADAMGSGILRARRRHQNPALLAQDPQILQPLGAEVT